MDHATNVVRFPIERSRRPPIKEWVLREWEALSPEERARRIAEAQQAEKYGEPDA
jgi:hypothetical protein